MSKISQIEAELMTLEQGKFQKLCNAFLFMKFQLPPRGEGEAKGTDKTKTGTPDSFIILPDGNFAFIEYSTQKTGLGGKFLGDLKKVFSEPKTGVPIEKIKKIYLGFNSQLSPSETNQIIDFCTSKAVTVEFIDLDFLKFELYNYPKLAKDFLNIEPDTEQILKPVDFINELEKKGTAQRNPFFAREEEMQQLFTLLTENDIIILTGKAGLGKTRIANESIAEFVHSNPEFEPLCITSKGQTLFYDLKAYFLPGHKYVVLIDDANRISDFHLIVSLFHSERVEIKILLTVRDYAFEKVKKQIESENLKFNSIELNSLKDETVKEILTSLKVTNPYCVNNITKISNGNPRLVIMAAEHALSDNNCDNLRDVTDIYDKFFDPVVSSVALRDTELLRTLGVICFFRAVNRGQENLIQSIYSVFDLDDNVFWECVIKLHELEIVDLYEKRIVKVSDQVLANYFFYHIFIKHDILDFYLILRHFLTDYKGKVKENLYPILEHFKYEEIFKKISPSLDKRFEEIKESEVDLVDFFEVFSFYKQEEILLFLSDKVKAMPQPEDVPFIFKREKNNNYWRDENKYPYLKILKSFLYFPNDHFTTSLEIAFAYICKKPDILPVFLEFIEKELIPDEDDFRYNYWIQCRFFDFIFGKIDHENEINLYVEIFFEVSPVFMSTSFQVTKNGRKKHSITFYNVQLQKIPAIESLRKQIFERVFSYYDILPERVVDFLSRYVGSYEHYPQKDIYLYDSTFIIHFIKESLSPDNTAHCDLVKAYFRLLERLEIRLSESDKILRVFRNNLFELKEALTYDYHDWHMEGKGENNLEYSDYILYNKNRLLNYFHSYTIEDYYTLINNVAILISHVSNDREAQVIVESFDIVLCNLLETSSSDCLLILNELFIRGNPLNFYSRRLVAELLFKYEPNVIYDIIYNNDYQGKQLWLLHFYMCLPENKILISDKNKLLDLVKSINISPFISFDFLIKYKSVEPKIFIELSSIILEKFENEKYYIDLFDLFRNHIGEFDEEYELLRNLYLYSLETQQRSFDYDGKYFLHLYKLNHNFLFEYFNQYFKNRHYFSDNDLKLDFSIVWDFDDAEEIIKKVIDFSIDEQVLSFDYHLVAKFFPKNNLNSRVEKFIDFCIENYAFDPSRLSSIFSTIRVCYPERRLFYLEKFLAINPDLETFQQLPIARGSFSGLVSSLIPFYERQINFWETVLPILAGKVEYLKHRQWVNEMINSLRNQIKREIEKDFIDDY